MDLIQVLWADVTCSGFSIPGKLAYLIAILIKLLQFGVPLLLIVFGMLDLGKAVIASKEDEIKKGQQMFIKRLITAVIVFFVVAIVRLVVNLATADDKKAVNGKNKIVECIDSVINYKID